MLGGQLGVKSTPIYFGLGVGLLEGEGEGAKYLEEGGGGGYGLERGSGLIWLHVMIVWIINEAYDENHKGIMR